MTDPIRQPLISPMLRRMAVRAGAALAAPAGRARPSNAPDAMADHVVIEGRVDRSGAASAAAADAYRAADRSVPDNDASAGPDSADGFRLVSRPVDLRDGRMVERFLPDILGRALARSWVDPGFRARLAADPKALLQEFDVHLPGSIWISTETGANQRPMIVVHERQPDGSLRRLLYLQLVMLAGK